VLGLIVFIGSGLVDLYPIPEVYGIVLIGISSAYLIYLLIDIRMHVNKAKKTMRERERIIEMYENQQAAKMEAMNGAAMNTAFEFPPYPTFNAKPISHRYCFVTGRHGELVYLKFGAACKYKDTGVIPCQLDKSMSPWSHGHMVTWSHGPKIKTCLRDII
jgi:hypothetical protein